MSKVLVPRDWYQTGKKKRSRNQIQIARVPDTQILRSEDLPQLMDPEEVAKILKVDVKLVNELISRGEIESIPVGLGKKRPRRRVTPEQLAHYLEMQSLRHG